MSEANILLHQQADKKIAEVVADSVIFQTAQEAFEFLMSLSYEHDVSKFILHQKNITPDFFVLKTRLAGEVLQKVTNYRMQLAIVGEFERVESESLRAFIIESNRGKQVFFVENSEAAKLILFSRDL